MESTPVWFLPARPALFASLLVASLHLTPSVWGQGTTDEGFRIMSAGNLGNCLACHSLPGQQDLRSTFAPALEKVATRYDADTLRQWVTDARKIKPATLMPPFGTTQGTNGAIRAQSILSAEQIELVVAALLTLR